MALQHMNSAEFHEALGKNGVMVVDFWATWCGPCRMLGPTIEKLAATYDGKAVVAKVDVDKSEDLAARYGIMSVPTVIFFKDGKEVDRKVGVQPLGAFSDAVDGLL